MTRLVEIGPFDHKDPSKWGENHSERRHLSRMEYEMSWLAGVSFSFEKHIALLASKIFPDVEALEILDGGCGEGRALWDFKQIGAKLGIGIKTTGVTMDREHIEWLQASGVDEIVIGTVQNFFQQEDHTGRYHFILDYNCALAGDDNPKTHKQGESIIPIYGKILVPRGSALLMTSSLDLNLLRENGLRVIWTERSYSLVSKIPL